MAITRIISFGDSMSKPDVAAGVATAAEMYANILRARYNPTTFVDAAITGSAHTKYLNAANTQLALAATDLTIGVMLFNSMRLIGTDPAIAVDLIGPLEATLAWFAVPESSKIRAVNIGTTTMNSAVTKTGTWAYFGLSPGTDLNNLAIRSSTASATATFPAVTGRNVYIWYARGVSNELFTVSIDGIPYSVGGDAVYDLTGNNWELCLLRVPGLAQGSHTVIATQSPDAATVVAVAGFSPLAIRQTAPAVIVGNCPYMITGVASSGYAFAGALANDPLTLSPGVAYGHAGVDRINVVLGRAVQNLQADGLRIRLIDVASRMQIPTMVDDDLVHPNTSGYRMFAQEFQRELDPLFNL